VGAAVACAPSGSAQCSVWSIVSVFCSTGCRGSEFTYLIVVGVPRWATTVGAGYWGAFLPTW
jgi:hypothetical protein